MNPVLFYSEATAELAEAVSYYETRRPGLGQALLTEVEQSVARIQEHPGIGARYKNSGLRHVVLRRFPYVLFYLELSQATWIVAVAHGKRRPGYWKSRILEHE